MKRRASIIVAVLLCGGIIWAFVINIRTASHAPPSVGVAANAAYDTLYGPPPPTTEEVRAAERASGAENERLGPAADPVTAEELASTEKKTRIGMTPEQVVRAWGRPKKINETRGARYHHEQWVYPANYLYFDNGALTTIQSSR